MIRALVLILVIASAGVGCSVPKGEGTLDKLANLKPTHKAPPGELTEKQIGVRFYPDATQGISHKAYDEAGMHILEAALSTSDSSDKVRDFYEREIGAKAMPLGTPGFFSIQRDADGHHYEVDFARMGDETSIRITVSTPQQ